MCFEKVMVSFLLVCVLLSGVSAAFAAVAGNLVSPYPSDWRRWERELTPGTKTFTIRTQLQQDISLFADPKTVWADAVFFVNIAGASLDHYSGVRITRTEYQQASNSVVFTCQPIPLRNIDDGSLWLPAGATGSSYIPTTNELLLEGVAFLRAGGSPLIPGDWYYQAFTSPFIVDRIPWSNEATDESGSSGGCSTGAFAPFAGVLLLSLVALVRRKP